MKSYKLLKDFIEKNGPFNLAWFTSFNFDIQFFEKYLLSIFSKQDYKEIRNVIDYENLNQKLFGDINNPFECAAFFDYRALKLNDIGKQTTVELFGINSKSLGSKFTNGVFHPKVMLLVNKDNKGFIVTGSSNLSFAAWSSNSESLIIKEIEDIYNANEVTNFFKSFINKEKIDKIDAINLIWQSELSKEKPQWYFHHSFMDSSLIDSINIKGSTLYIWSPYFSSELERMCNENFSEAEKINIIPDVSVNNEVRIALSTLKNIKQNKRIEILKDCKVFETETKPFVHAKVILNQSTIAIGSWNLTDAGFNLVNGRSNIEAGIIINLSKHDYQSIFNSLRLEGLNPIGKLEEELKNDVKSLLHDWKMLCSISIDWATLSYNVEDEINFEVNKYFVNLPDRLERLDLHTLQNQNISFEPGRVKLLNNRIFSVFPTKTGGSEIYIGVLIEKNKSLRPSMKFDSLNDLFNAWLDENPEEKEHLQVLNAIPTNEFLLDELGQKVNSNYSNSWFTMFIALEKMKIRLRANENNKEQLQALGTKIAGSILELSDHLEQYKKNQNINKVYTWFMINEGNQVINLYNTIGLKFNLLKIGLVKNIEISFNKEELKWINYIKKECEYEFR